MSIQFNDSYLNKTPHKTPLPAGKKKKRVGWHETVGSASSSLNWGLSPKSKVSWEYLIARNGTIYRYVDPARFTSWHLGEATILNEDTIGVEVEGPNDGTPITPQQRDAIIELMLYFQQEFSIPLDRRFHHEHGEVALPKGRKDDPQGFSVDVALDLAIAEKARRQPPPEPAPDIQRVIASVEAHLVAAQEGLQLVRLMVGLQQSREEPKP